MYIWELPDWPAFGWDQARLIGPVARGRHAQGRLLGRMEAIGFDLQTEALLATLTQDVVTSSEIEGERLDSEQVRSSIARRLGLDIGGLLPADRDVDGVVEMMLDATQDFARPLDAERLFGWHAALFPGGRSGMRRIGVGRWRDDADGPMQVVSGPPIRARVHFEAPPAGRVPAEMERFLAWFNADAETEPLLMAAQAHLWFVTIHPFDDGNGRIARAISDMVLARSERSEKRFYSMSAQIRVERSAYYAMLERTQKATLDVTDWMVWFSECLERAIAGAQAALAFVTRKAAFWERHAGAPFNARQTKVLNRLLDGFEGRLTTSRWAGIAQCSQDTAHRDILDLIGRDILAKGPGRGRSTSYVLVDPPAGVAAT